MEHTAATEYYNAYVHSNLMHYNALKLIVVLNSCPKISQVKKPLYNIYKKSRTRRHPDFCAKQCFTIMKYIYIYIYIYTHGPWPWTHGYNRVSKTCDLCLNEKLEILNFKDRDKLLNKRSELISKCRHFNKYLLKNMK